MNLLFVAFLFQADPTYVVSGTVVNRLDNRPLSNARVSLGAPNVEPVVTSPDGRFRFESLKAGKYRLTAERSGYARQSYRQRSLNTNLSTAIVTGDHQETENLVFGLIPGGVISGTVSDARGNPVAGMRIMSYPVVGFGENRHVGATFRFAVTDDRGEYRMPGLSGGSYVVVFAGWTASAIPSSSMPSAYPIAYFPGTTEAGGAGILRLEPGKEVRADAILNPVPAAQVNGEILLPNLPPGSWVFVSIPGPLGSEPQILRAPLTGNRFSFANLPVGQYYFNLQDDQGRPLGRTAARIESADAAVSIGATRFARVLESVEVRGTPRNPNSPTVVRLFTPGMQGVRNADAEGHAVIPSMPPGQYEVTVTKGAPLAILSMTAQGATVAGGLVNIPETGDVNLTIVADASAAQNISGRVLRGDKPEGGLLVALVPAKDWRNTLAYRFDQSDSDGSFTWPAVPPGEYLTFAFEEGEPADYADAQVLSKLAEKAEKITISGDPKQRVTVQVTPH